MFLIRTLQSFCLTYSKNIHHKVTWKARNEKRQNQQILREQKIECLQPLKRQVPSTYVDTLEVWIHVWMKYFRISLGFSRQTKQKNFFFITKHNKMKLDTNIWSNKWLVVTSNDCSNKKAFFFLWSFHTLVCPVFCCT